eukprot:Sspe_Gene.89414::Locus_61184_Transcript_1_5_Confidence_0.667_Length_419::g.89414::m.89414
MMRRCPRVLGQPPDVFFDSSPLERSLFPKDLAAQRWIRHTISTKVRERVRAAGTGREGRRSIPMLVKTTYDVLKACRPEHRPSRHTYYVAVRGFIRSGSVEWARRVIDLMQEHGMSPDSR